MDHSFILMFSPFCALSGLPSNIIEKHKFILTSGNSGQPKFDLEQWSWGSGQSPSIIPQQHIIGPAAWPHANVYKVLCGELLKHFITCWSKTAWLDEIGKIDMDKSDFLLTSEFYLCCSMRIA